MWEHVPKQYPYRSQLPQILGGRQEGKTIWEPMLKCPPDWTLEPKWHPSCIDWTGAHLLWFNYAYLLRMMYSGTWLTQRVRSQPMNRSRQQPVVLPTVTGPFCDLTVGTTWRVRVPLAVHSLSTIQPMTFTLRVVLLHSKWCRTYKNLYKTYKILNEPYINL